jgi:hypothetical protein
MVAQCKLRVPVWLHEPQRNRGRGFPGRTRHRSRRDSPPSIYVGQSGSRV